ncbi:MAG: hypothetical protein D6710_01125 [Nitrospirae bacterium]|nr:MAG: hypothetical protein D6710_01125 [Nitrospirota bacterium]
MSPYYRERQPRPHERRWHNYWVDRNLEDRWLEALNSLHAFKLISICEGHIAYKGRSTRTPHINLRMKRRFLRLFVRKFNDLSVDLYRTFVTLFNDDDTYIDIEYKIRFKSSHRGRAINRDVVIHVRSRNPRTSEEMDEQTKRWFEQIVERLRGFDRFIKERLLEYGGEEGH